MFEADARTRTADPFITSEVLYQLSYVGTATPRNTVASEGPAVTPVASSAHCTGTGRPRQAGAERLPAEAAIRQARDEANGAAFGRITERGES